MRGYDCERPLLRQYNPPETDFYVLYRKIEVPHKDGTVWRHEALREDGWTAAYIGDDDISVDEITEAEAVDLFTRLWGHTALGRKVKEVFEAPASDQGYGDSPPRTHI